MPGSNCLERIAPSSRVNAHSAFKPVATAGTKTTGQTFSNGQNSMLRNTQHSQRSWRRKTFMDTTTLLIILLIILVLGGGFYGRGRWY
jgi:hypothetical protein